jgi:hypothetical protein
MILEPHEIAAVILATVAGIAAVYLSIHLSMMGGSDYALDFTENGLGPWRWDYGGGFKPDRGEY